MQYQIIRATVLFVCTGEPEVVMSEVYNCEKPYPPEAFAATIARTLTGHQWLWDSIEIVSINYLYRIVE